MSISKQQAAALAEGFLDDIGSGDADAIEPRETFTELILLAGELVESAQDNLNKAMKIASGKLSESIVASSPEVDDKTLFIDITMLFYGAFVNSGVKGVKSGRSTAGYSFKNLIVSKKMVEAIQVWIKRSARQVRTENAHKSTYKLEKKRAKISELNKGRAMAYAVARGIKAHGLKPTGFMDDAISETSRKVEDRLGNALVVDVLNSI